MLGVMTFGQSSGPPATARQVQQLLELIHDAGHADFRDARGPMGFTQRQAAGRFSRDEAEALIVELETAAHEGEALDATTGLGPTPKARSADVDAALRDVSAARLAAELQRRGWIVVEP